MSVGLTAIVCVGHLLAIPVIPVCSFSSVLLCCKLGAGVCRLSQGCTIA